MTAVTLPAEIRPRVAQLLRLLGSDQDGEVIAAVRAIGRTLDGAGVDLNVLAAVLDPPDPICVPQVRSKCRTTSTRQRQAERLTRAAADPYSKLTRWEKDFATSIVPALRSDIVLSEKQTATLQRVLAKIRRRRS